MNLPSYYFIFKEAVPTRICDDIIRLGLSLTPKLATTRGYNEGEQTKSDLDKLKKKRDSQITWLDDPWIYNLVHPVVRLANKHTGWNFEWNWSERAQFTIYRPEHHYGWHCDSGPGPYKEGPYSAKIRKISSILILSDRSEYEGGEFEIDPRHHDPDDGPPLNSSVKHLSEIENKGTIVVFPSFVWHRIKPVTKGVRYSVPLWHLGQPWQ